MTLLYFRSFKGHVNFYHMNMTTHNGNFFSSPLELAFRAFPQPHAPFSENAPHPQSGLPYLVMLSWPQLVGWGVDTLPKPDQSNFSSNSSWANHHLFLWCLEVRPWNATQVISGAGAERLGAVPGLGWPFPLLRLEKQSQSSERKGWGRHVTSGDKKPRPPGRQCSRVISSLCYVNWRLNALISQPPLQLGPAMLFRAGHWHVSEDHWEGFSSGLKGRTSLGESFLPFVLLPCLLFVSWSSDLELEQPSWGSSGDKQRAEAHLQGQWSGKTRGAWGSIPVSCTVPELPTSVLHVV